MSAPSANTHTSIFFSPMELWLFVHNVSKNNEVEFFLPSEYAILE